MSALPRRRWTSSPEQFTLASVEEFFHWKSTPRPRGVKKLARREEYRLRVGDYRVLYTIDDKDSIVTIFAVGHRREVYR